MYISLLLDNGYTKLDSVNENKRIDDLLTFTNERNCIRLWENKHTSEVHYFITHLHGDVFSEIQCKTEWELYNELNIRLRNYTIDEIIN